MTIAIDGGPLYFTFLLFWHTESHLNILHVIQSRFTIDWQVFRSHLKRDWMPTKHRCCIHPFSDWSETLLKDKRPLKVNWMLNHSGNFQHIWMVTEKVISTSASSLPHPVKNGSPEFIRIRSTENFQSVVQLSWFRKMARNYHLSWTILKCYFWTISNFVLKLSCIAWNGLSQLTTFWQWPKMTAWMWMKTLK
jgi:hypothetical protein